MDYQYKPMKKYVYVKQHVMDNIKSGQSKVLINPNFMKPPVVHINPHFKTNVTIHVNPNVLKPPPEPKTIIPLPSNPTIKPPPLVTKLVSPNKIIRTPLASKNKYKLDNTKKGEKSSFKVDNRTKVVAKGNKLLVNLLKNKYKIDNTKKLERRSIKVDNSVRKVISKGNKRLVNIKNVYVKCNKKMSITVNTNRKRLINTKISVKKNSLLRSSDKYKYTIKNKVYFKNNSIKTLISPLKYKSTAILKNKLKKSNMPCPFYRKFGRCKGKENGTCIRKHNSDQISLCPRFLQGACFNNECLLSHKVSAEKMPTCRFYLEGLCSRDDCPFLHVKISAKAEICKDFLEGFCRKGVECDKRHQHLCPDFEKKGTCRKKKCQYPHKNAVRDNTILKRVPPKLQTQIKPATVIKELPEKSVTARYYDGQLPKPTSPDSENSESRDNRKKRPTLGDLPSFIPFMSNDELR